MKALWLSSEQPKRFRLQSVAGENRHALAMHHVRRRPSAPQVIVVHRRQIVVDQRVGVNHLDRARGRHGEIACRGFGGATRLRDAFGAGNHQQRPQPLAAAKQAVAHRVDDDWGRRRAWREKS